MSLQRENLLPDRPLRWALAFAALYALLHGLTLLLGPLVDVVSGQISLIYLPAFARVVSVVVAGAAGVAGIVAGSLFINLVVYGMGLAQAISVSAASAFGIFAAYWVLQHALMVPTLPIRLSSLIALTGLYCTFNAITHGFIWALFDISPNLTVAELTLMMLGDLVGVVVMFAACRAAIRWFRRSSAGADASSGSPY